MQGDVDMQQKPGKKKADGMNWVGTLFFILLIFGQPIARFLSNLTGHAISSSVILPLLFGALALITVVSFVMRGLSGLTEEQQSTPLPRSSSPPVSKPRPKPSSFTSTSPYNKSRASSSSFTSTTDLRKLSSRSGMGSQKLPGPPQFEPIIDPRVLVLGIVGLILLGGVFVGLSLFSMPTTLTP